MTPHKSPPSTAAVFLRRPFVRHFYHSKPLSNCSNDNDNDNDTKMMLGEETKMSTLGQQNTNNESLERPEKVDLMIRHEQAPLLQSVAFSDGRFVSSTSSFATTASESVTCKQQTPLSCDSNKGPLYGRQEELHFLKSRIQAILSKNNVQDIAELVLITGPSGVG